MKSKLVTTTALALVACTLSLVPEQRAEAVTMFLNCGSVEGVTSGGPPSTAGCKVTYFPGGSGRYMQLSILYQTCTPDCVIVPPTGYKERTATFIEVGAFGLGVGTNCFVPNAGVLVQGLAFNLSSSRTNPIVQQIQKSGLGIVPLWCGGSVPSAVTLN